MTQVSLTKIIAIILTSISICFTQSYKWNNPGSLPSGYTHATYRSTLMNTDIGYSIYLPPNYNSSTERYPVVYSLHGMGGNENGNCQTYSGVMQSGITGNSFPPVIVVFVNGRGNTFYSDSKDGTVKCESSIIKELIPHIDATYRTKADRTQRAVEGISMGGFGALMLGFKHPDMFSSIGTYDAALVNWDTLSQQTFDRSIPTQIFGSDREYFNNNSYPFTFAKENGATIKSLGIKVRMITGDNDLQMGPLYYYNCAMRDTLNKLGIDLTFKVIAGGKHGDGMNATTVKENMIFHTTNFKEAITGIIQRAPTKGVSQHSCISSVAFSSAQTPTFHIPSQWHMQSIASVQVFDLRGRCVGQLPLQGEASVDYSTIQKLTRSGVYTFKALR